MSTCLCETACSSYTSTRMTYCNKLTVEADVGIQLSSIEQAPPPPMALIPACPDPAVLPTVVSHKSTAHKSSDEASRDAMFD
ncbi:hypothetical protein PRBEI_2000552800 [Prionailurus iriomotensis]